VAGDRAEAVREARPQTRRRAAWAALAIGVAGGLAALLASDLPARFLTADDRPARSDAIVVMAGDPDYERTTTAAALIKAGHSPLLVLTGGEHGPGDSAESLRARALALGVDARKIRVETTSHSTREAVLAVAPILQSVGAHTVTLVTSPYHQRRAAASARRAWPGITVLSHPASPSSWRPHQWWREPRSRQIVTHEYLKLLYYLGRGWV
jgi:uncharacterized SAM-binding protein YcdF (DUF218 family)